VGRESANSQNKATAGIVILAEVVLVALVIDGMLIAQE
jgi:hypothetical protein